MRIMVTGANGQLGRLVLSELIRIEGIEVLAGVRRPESIGDLPSKKIQVAKSTTMIQIRLQVPCRESIDCYLFHRARWGNGLSNTEMSSKPRGRSK